MQALIDWGGILTLHPVDPKGFLLYAGLGIPNNPGGTEIISCTGRVEDNSPIYNTHRKTPTLAISLRQVLSIRISFSSLEIRSVLSVLDGEGTVIGAGDTAVALS